jgi:hypothetical protein
MIAFVYLWPSGDVRGYDPDGALVYSDGEVGVADRVFARATTTTRYLRVRPDGGLCQMPGWEFELRCRELGR